MGAVGRREVGDDIDRKNLNLLIGAAK